MEWPPTPRGQRPNQEYFYMGSTNCTNSGPTEHGYGDAGRGNLNFTSRMPQTIAAEAQNDYRKIFEWAAVHSKEFVPAALRAQRAMSRPQKTDLEEVKFDPDYSQQMFNDNGMPNFQNFHIDLPDIDIFPPSEGSLISSPPSPAQKTIAQLFKEKVWARAQEPNHHVLFNNVDEPYEFNFKGVNKHIFYPHSSDSESSGSKNTESECSGLNKLDTKISGLKNGSQSPRMEKAQCKTEEKIHPMAKNKRYGVRR